MNEQILSQLERLAKLREQGAITSTEFEQQKAALLNHSQPPQSTLNSSKPVESPVSVQPQDKTSLGKIIIFGVAALFLIITLGRLFKKEQPASQTTNVDDALVDTTSGISASTEITPAPQAWYYTDDTDKMGAKYKIASLDANELLNFDFPYQGGSTATLIIRRKAGDTDMYLRVSKGQFMTSSYEGRTLRVRLDEGKPRAYTYVGAADGSSDVIFFESPYALIQRMKKAKKMIIEVEFYSEGNRQIEFNIAGLKWP